MTLKEYYTEAIKFAIYPEQYKIQYPLVGLGGEFGEVMDKIKKVWRDNNGVFTDESCKAVAKELGDVCWYVMACARDLDFRKLILNQPIWLWDQDSMSESLSIGNINAAELIRYGERSEICDNFHRARMVLSAVNSIAVKLGYTMEEILQMNIDKLTARMEQDKLGGSGDDREELTDIHQ